MRNAVTLLLFLESFRGRDLRGQCSRGFQAVTPKVAGKRDKNGFMGGTKGRVFVGSSPVDGRMSVIKYSQLSRIVLLFVVKSYRKKNISCDISSAIFILR
ncbi:hypothetical protein NPIL_71231 [Nephila pilipes]|uniref:Uncharacterized protein n=1 Tax=Nephila pilipes TaxID=299642 RepID=A0A8X6IC87_NEPPI|nr:hypothetical protein NPIL_71231 [Nephila pilipes]